MPKSDKQVQEDPFLLLGFGVNNYFDIMKSLMNMFTCISIFMLPLLYCYSHNSQSALKSDPMYFLTKFSLGNYGGSTMNCVTKPVLTSEFDLTC